MVYTQDRQERLYTLFSLGTSQVSPRGAGKHCEVELGRLNCNSDLAATPT